MLPSPSSSLSSLSLFLNESRCISLLNISSNTKQVKQIHAHMMTNSLLNSPPNLSKLIKQYVSFNNPKESIKLFAQAPSLPDKFAYIYTFRACAELGSLREGMQANCRAIKSGLILDIAVRTTAIHFYSSCKDIVSARNMFDEMPTKNSVAWNAMLTAYCTNGAPKEMFSLLHGLCRPYARPTERTATALLSGCSQLEDLALASSVHGFIYKFTPVNRDCFIGTGLIDMYSKCGSLDSASKMFHELRERNVQTWTAMVAGLSMHGKGKEALDLMDEMIREGVFPNEVTFTCALSACCHSGLLEEGVRIFDALKGRFGVEPSVYHYACIVDLMGRAGLVEEARELVRTMGVEPDLVVWRALLSACKVHGKVEIGEEVGRRLLKLEKENRGEDDKRSCEDFVALSNVYASAERWEDVEMVRGTMKCLRVENKAGCSSVQIVQG